MTVLDLAAPQQHRARSQARKRAAHERTTQQAVFLRWLPDLVVHRREGMRFAEPMQAARQALFPRPHARMKILLTGATGFIGSRLRGELLARGHAVLGVA